MNFSSVQERDPQQLLAYNWEIGCLTDPRLLAKLDLHQCEILARRICKRHGVEAPLLIRGNSRDVAQSLDIFFNKEGVENSKVVHLIQLPPGDRNVSTLIHECCHFFKHEIDHGSSHHGPIFVRLMIDEVVHFLKGGEKMRKDLEESARKRGLKFCESGVLYNRKKPSVILYTNRVIGCEHGLCTECARIHG